MGPHASIEFAVGASIMIAATMIKHDFIKTPAFLPPAAAGRESEILRFGAYGLSHDSYSIFALNASDHHVTITGFNFEK
jgi:hypothetical protein